VSEHYRKGVIMIKKLNKPISFILAVLLIMALFSSVQPMTALAATGDTGTTNGWRWIVQADDTLAITGYSGSGTELTLPGTLSTGSAGLGDLPVTRIENNAFEPASTLFPPGFISFDMSSSNVTSIGDRAFFWCVNMTSVTLSPNLESIGVSAFYNCRGLIDIVIPDSVESIGSAAFSNCDALDSVTLPDNAGFTAIPDNLFKGDGSLETTNIASLTHLESIGSQAFFDSGIISITLPNSVTSIGSGAFNACRSLKSITLPDNTGFTVLSDKLFFECKALESLTIPASVYSIGADAFNGCNMLEEINVDEDNEDFSSENGVLYNLDKTLLICHPAGREGELDIPDSVTEIGDYAFYNSADLTGVSIPNGMTTIGEGAFLNCLNTVFDEPVLPDSVTSIGASAFSGCKRLTEISIPEGVTVIGENTFYNCTGLLEIVLPESLTVIGEGAFSGCDSLHEVTVPENVSTVGNWAFAFCSSLKKATILNDNTSFGSNVFIFAPMTGGSERGIYGFSESTAQAYATNNSIPFYILCTVSFSTGGGSVVPDILAVSGSAIAVPSDPIRPGYSFDGWHKDAEGTVPWDFANDKVAGGMALYAKWTQITAPTYALTITAGTGGRITSSSNERYASGAVISIVAEPNSGYSFKEWTSTGGGTFGSTTSAATTFTMPAGEAAIIGSFTYNGGGGGGTTPKEEHKIKTVVSGNTATVTVPRAAAESDTTGGTGTFEVSTPVASIAFDADAISTILEEADEDIIITASRVDPSSLPEDTQQLVGDRPVFNFSVTSGNQTISEFGGNVSVSVPYTPKAGEDPDSIVIYYINAQGQPEMVSNCAYNPATGTVSFTTNHFSKYAVGYNKVNFNDVKPGAWYEDAVDFVAARGIVTGTGNGNFDPAGKLTRGQLLVMLMRAYGIAPDTDFSSNFSDAGNTYYTGYLAAAKRLGITAGTGNNLYAPDRQITRQEMFTLLYNTLKQMDELPAGAGGETMAYSDTDSVAAWAKDAASTLTAADIVSGSGGKLLPKNTTSRAEMAQVIYNLLSK